MKYELHPNTIDLVIGGPDFSGTSTQINDVIDFLKAQRKKIRDIRGDEDGAVFHAEKFLSFNAAQRSLHEFLDDIYLDAASKATFKDALWRRKKGTNVRELLQASMIRNDVSTYVNPNSADVWIMEEPSYRSAGNICRNLELYRTKYLSKPDQRSAAENHSGYRTDEFERFRRWLRESGKTIVRSRSEESACYQIYEKDHLPGGVDVEYYLNLAGHKTAFANPPTHLFIACAPADFSKKDYIEFKMSRKDERIEDDYEKDVDFQLMVNKRYATDWHEKLYHEACWAYAATPPKIYRFDMRLPKEEIRKQMHEKLSEILYGVNVNATIP